MADLNDSDDLDSQDTGGKNYICAAIDYVMLILFDSPSAAW